MVVPTQTCPLGFSIPAYPKLSWRLQIVGVAMGTVKALDNHELLLRCKGPELQPWR